MNLKLTSISSLQLFQLMRFGTFILIGIIFTKTQLSTEAIGEYEQFLFLAGGVSFFWLNGLIRSLLSIANESREDHASPIFNAFLLISALSVLVIIALALGSRLFGEQLLGEATGPYLPLLLAYLFFSVPANLVEYFFLLKKQPGRILRYGVISFLLMLILVSLPPVIGFDIQWSLYGLLGVAVGRYGYLLVLLLRAGENRYSASFMQKHWQVALPLIFSALLSGSAQYVDGFIVTSYFDEATFAVFRYGARELPLVVLLANAFSNALLPEFSDKGRLVENLSRIKSESLRLSNVLFPLSAVMLLCSHALFPVVFNAGFAASATIFNVYILLTISRLLFPQTILIGLQKTRMIAWASAGELLLNVCLSLWFVQLWGIVGVAYATVVAYLFEKLFLAVVVKQSLNIGITKYQNCFRHLIYSLLLLALFIIVEFVMY
ncbi:lipopolysaccharide biosynthesis protein [Sunxiuqinia elliptica]|uniref:Membrane protein involved in the export of O-antigen and teichoic acid n=1 Tax=Sunxiuqinia elliptica TaxID=655355 RepID=A0A1I2K8U1_9BACT|nr:polysaccharide biosynthesis C-terminal domain-containing protein [Sunxiuqinia elliptica]SFF63555.1 Membrane protein involved in the export of O-antigen and teichoic acid [Sunxiuqinia elliptica]